MSLSGLSVAATQRPQEDTESSWEHKGYATAGSETEGFLFGKVEKQLNHLKDDTLILKIQIGAIIQNSESSVIAEKNWVSSLSTLNKQNRFSKQEDSSQKKDLENRALFNTFEEIEQDLKVHQLKLQFITGFCDIGKSGVN